MQNKMQVLVNKRHGRSIRDLLFFVLFYLYFWLEVELHFMFYAAGKLFDFPVFFQGWDFFRDFLVYPGGLTEYTASFLAQLYYYSLAGAAVITLLAWLLSISTNMIIKAFNVSLLRPIRFVGPVLLLIMYSQYTSYIILTIALLLALLFLCIHIKITRKNKFVIIIVFIESAVLYYLAGGAFLLFILLCAVYETFLRNRLLHGILCVFLAIGIPYIIGVRIFNLYPKDAFSNLTIFLWKTVLFQDRAIINPSVYILYSFVPLVILLKGLWHLLRAVLPSPGFGYTKITTIMLSLKKYILWYTNAGIVKWSIDSLPLILIIAGSIYFFKNNERKAEFEIDYYVYNKMWPNVIEVTERYPDKLLAVHSSNLALFHTGRLGYDFFHFNKTHQSLGMLLLHTAPYKEMHWNKANIYLEVGPINHAYRFLAIALDHYGKLPAILERMAFIHMIKGDNNSAKVFLNSLKRTLFHKDRANHYLSLLESDPTLSTVEDIQYYRKLIMPKDRLFFYRDERIDKIMLELLENRKNRAAFEYLMSMYLLAKEPQNIVKNIYRLKDLGYDRIPRLYEEAILIYNNATKKETDLHNYRINPESLKRFKDFNNIWKRHKYDKKTAFSDLKEFADDSYLFYYLYGVPEKR